MCVGRIWKDMVLCMCMYISKWVCPEEGRVGKGKVLGFLFDGLDWIRMNSNEIEWNETK